LWLVCEPPRPPSRASETSWRSVVPSTSPAPRARCVASAASST